MSETGADVISRETPDLATKLSAADILAQCQGRVGPDPRTVLPVVVTFNALAMSRAGMSLMLVLAAIAVLALASARAFSWALSLLAIDAVWLVMIFVIPKLWQNAFTAFLMVLGYLMFKFCIAGGIAAWAIKVIVPGELTAGLRKLHVPIAVTVPTTVLLRFIPTALREYKAVREAMALRGLQMGWQAWLHPLRYLEFILVPLLSSCARIADEMTAAGMVRGLGSKIRPVTLKRLRFSYPDLIWITVAVALVAAVPWFDGINIVPGGFK